MSVDVTYGSILDFHGKWKVKTSQIKWLPQQFVHMFDFGDSMSARCMQIIWSKFNGLMPSYAKYGIVHDVKSKSTKQ